MVFQLDTKSVLDKEIKGHFSKAIKKCGASKKDVLKVQEKVKNYNGI